jgi:hypothetical protein
MGGKSYHHMLTHKSQDLPIGVLIIPGAYAFTVIPLQPSSIAYKECC